MRCVLLLAGFLALGACGPSFEEKLSGTWQCRPVTSTPGRTISYTLNYKPEGEVNGELVFTETTEEATASVRGDLSGTWSHDGDVLSHKIKERFKNLTVNDKVVPEKEVNPQIIAGFRGEDNYGDPVALIDNELVWYTNAERTEVGARCTKNS